ncbi:MAG: hypothetical protein ACU0DI_09520 [Paracoccaceae bacterium]
MLNPEPIGWLNTGLPLLLLVGGAIILPRMISRRDTRSHLVVMMAIASTALCLIVLGAIIFTALYVLQGTEVSAAFSENAPATVVFFLRLSAKFALAWAPILALVWFVAAQAVEKRRGEDIARRDAP